MYNTMSMSARAREKIALVVFAALIVLSLLGLGWYLFAGHSWNVAASNIDDTFGSMRGYTAIVYAGTVEPKVSSKTTPGTTGESGASGAYSEEPSAADLAAKTAASVGEKKKSVKVADAKESYEDKEATVFSLDTLHPENYTEGTILKKGNHRFGVFSVSEPVSLLAIKTQVAYFADYEVDFIVALTPDKAYVEDVEGIDIVLSTQDEELFVMGETLNGTFYVDAPQKGAVGVILISPSNVVSAKVVEEL